MTKPASPAADPAVEKPLTGFSIFLLVASAALAIALFYGFIVVVVILLLALLAVELVLAIVLLRFGLTRAITPHIQRHSGVLMLCLRSFWLGKGVQFQVPLEEPDAPALFAFLRTLSQKLGVPAPRRVRMEMNAGAWVLLKGFRRGSRDTTLGLGYDLVAGLTEREIEAVLAHEMAHAKLVRRGFRTWLGGGVARAIKLTSALSGLVNAYRRGRQDFTVGEILLSGADRCTRLAVRLVATYSRQDEFDADRGAAQICGAASLGSALLKLRQMEAKTSRIGWNERVARLQRGDGFSAWLTEELAVSDSNLSDEPAAVTDRYSTHPSIRDRLAALPADTGPVPASRPAITLFANPDAVAKKLVAEIQRVAAIEEAKDDRKQRAWLRKNQTGSNLRPLQVLSIPGGIACGVLVFLAFADPSSAVGLLLGGAAVLAGTVWLYRHGRYRDRRALPIPEFEILQAAREKDDDPKAREARENELVADLKARTAKMSRKQSRERFIVESYAALEKCDYLRAHVTARHGVQQDGKNVETLLAFAVATAAMHQRSSTMTMLGSVQQQTKFHSPSTLWGGGWALLLLGDFFGAEAMLTAWRRQQPGHPTVTALLAVCQMRRNKHFSAMANARSALAAAPQSVPRIELLANLLINTGSLSEAEQLLAGAGPAAREDSRLLLARIRVHLLQRNFAEADGLITQLQIREISPATMIDLAQACEAARRDDQAAQFFSAALERGYFPEAHVGLAQLALHRRDFTTAKAAALEALDTSRTLGEKANGPLVVFSQVLGHMLALQEPTAEARAWTATITGNAAAGPLANLTFIVYATDQPRAESYVKTVADAVQPGKPSLVPAYVDWMAAPSDQQPAGVVRPGIQRYWKS